MTAAYLTVLAALVAVAACRWLPGARWVSRAPRWGLAAWYVVLTVTVVSAVGAVATLVVHWPTAWGTAWGAVCALWTGSYEALTGGMGIVARVAAVAAAALTAGFGIRMARSGVRAAGDARRRRRDQQALLALVGRWDPRLQAVVVDHPTPAAYLVPGRAGAVVVTTGAVTGLPPTQLAAVLAHERAHAAGRHHLLVRGARVLAHALPALEVFGRAWSQVARLAEIRADEVAAHRYGRPELARALVTCAQAAAVEVPAVPRAATAPCPGPVPAPGDALAATGGDALERVHRLLWPPPPLSGPARVLVATGLTATGAAPLLLVGLLATFPQVAACLPLA